MPLGPGAKLGPYEVLAPLGAGGMGEVWRARDTKLRREVALKILPELFATDPDRLASTMTSEAPMAFSSPRSLFTDRFERPQPDGHITYDVAPDGRFLMIAAPARAEGGAGRNELHVVLNWFEDLKARAPTK